jgi:hypothetical protein
MHPGECTGSREDRPSRKSSKAQGETISVAYREKGERTRYLVPDWQNSRS